MKLRSRTVLVIGLALLGVMAYFLLRQPAIKVTPANIMQLKYGMTKEQVLDLLGPSLDMTTYRLDDSETYKDGHESFVAYRYRLHAPDRPDLPAYRVLHPCKGSTAFDTTPQLSNLVFLGKEYAVFVTMSPFNKLFRAFVYPIISEGVETLPALEYHFDKLVGNFRAPSNAPVPAAPPLPPPPLPPDFGINVTPQNAPRPVAESPSEKK